MKILSTILLLLFLNFSWNAFGQSAKEIDSLVTTLNSAKEDTNKILILDRLAHMHAQINPDKGIKWAGEALILATKLNWKTGIALAHFDLSVNYLAQGDKATALSHAEKSLQTFTNVGNRKFIAAALANMANVYLSQSNYLKALDFAFKSVKLYEEIEDRMHMSIMYENIGTMYKEQERHEEAMQYYREAYRINTERNDKISLARNSGNIGVILNVQGKHDSALIYTKVAMDANRETGNNHGMQINMANLANIYFTINNYHRALEYHKQALAISQETGHKSCMAINYGNLGETYYSIATDTARADPNKAFHLSQAIINLERSTQLCKEINYPAPRLEFLTYLKKAYAANGDYKNALETYTEFVALKDSIFSQDNKAAIAQLEANRKLEIKTHDIEIKDAQLRVKELELAEKQKERIIYIISAVLLIVILGRALKHLNTTRKSNKKLQVENRVIESKRQHSEFRLRQAQAIAHIGSWEMDLSTGTAFWSEECCRIYGLPVDANEQTFEKWKEFIHPEDVPHVTKIIAEAERTQKPAQFYSRIVRPDGQVRHLYTEAHYEHDAKGNLKGVYGISQDVTEAKKREEEIRESNQRFELIKKATREAILDWDIVNDNVILGNGFRETFGYSLTEKPGLLVIENIHSEDKDRVLKSVKELLDDPTRNSLEIDFRFLRANGTPANVQVRMLVIRDENGRPTRAVGSMMDISRLINKKRALEQQNAALRDIAWTQSHVLRSPLASLIGLVEILKNKQEFPDINETELIDNILSVARELDNVVHEVVRKTEAVEYTFQNNLNDQT